MIELVLAAAALALPADRPPLPVTSGGCCAPPVCPTQATIPQPSTPQPPIPPGLVPIGVPPPCGGTAGVVTGPPSYSPTLILPKRIHTGEHLRVWSAEQVPGDLCYAIGSSKVGCATSNIGAWYIVVRPGRIQYVTFREDGHVVDRRLYRNGRLVPHRR